ncbi:MAG: hypothetical protein DME97_16655 [Verrucomicrobia bacterium]|nr:MAG: hypothetical protein DME97_16655 [Verrucomicrobiota bacterium]
MFASVAKQILHLRVSQQREKAIDAREVLLKTVLLAIYSFQGGGSVGFAQFKIISNLLDNLLAGPEFLHGTSVF